MVLDPKRVEAVFSAALQASSPDERSALLDEACAGDPALRQRVEALMPGNRVWMSTFHALGARLLRRSK